MPIDVYGKVIEKAWKTRKSGPEGDQKSECRSCVSQRSNQTAALARDTVAMSTGACLWGQSLTI